MNKCHKNATRNKKRTNSAISRGRLGSSWSLWFWAVALDAIRCHLPGFTVSQHLPINHLCVFFVYSLCILCVSLSLSMYIYIYVYICTLVYISVSAFSFYVMLTCRTESQSYRQQPPSSAFNHLLGEAVADLASKAHVKSCVRNSTVLKLQNQGTIFENLLDKLL